MKIFNNFFIDRDEEIRFFLFLCLGLSLFVVASYVMGSRVEREDNSMPTELVKASFPEIDVRARAAYVYDVRSGEVLFAKNEDTRMPLASLTKVMSALVASSLGEDYGVVTVDEAALETAGDSGLRPGEKWSLKDLLDFSLITSSNDGIRATALALGALNKSSATAGEIINDFVVQMNEKATELGLKNTYFWNETGLDETEYKGGAYGTAKDMAKLLEYIITNHPKVLEATKESSMVVSSSTFSHEARNTNVLASKIPGLIASKTGFTNTAGGNLVLAFDPELGRPIIITILGSTEDGRFQDAALLINAVLRYIKQD